MSIYKVAKYIFTACISTASILHYLCCFSPLCQSPYDRVNSCFPLYSISSPTTDIDAPESIIKTENSFISSWETTDDRNKCAWKLKGVLQYYDLAESVAKSNKMLFNKSYEI